MAPDGSQMGIMPLPQALDFARQQDLDLVEVAPNATPPVCRVMDHGKYKYEQDQRRKEAKKKQSHISVKEMKFRPKIDEHDFDTKVKHVERFLREGSKVKLTIMFRGREVSHPELGRRILDRVADQVEEIGEVEAYPKIDGRNMTMVLGPARGGRRKRRAETPSAVAPEEHEEPVSEDAPAEEVNDDEAVAQDAATPEPAPEEAAAEAN